MVAFEACSSFKRVPACKVARPPKVDFFTRFRLVQLPNSPLDSYRIQPSTIRVGPNPTGNLPLWGTRLSADAAASKTPSPALNRMADQQASDESWSRRGRQECPAGVPAPRRRRKGFHGVPRNFTDRGGPRGAGRTQSQRNAVIGSTRTARREGARDAATAANRTTRIGTA